MVSDALLSIPDKACTEDEAAWFEKAVKEACASVYSGKSTLWKCQSKLCSNHPKLAAAESVGIYISVVPVAFH